MSSIKQSNSLPMPTRKVAVLIFDDVEVLDFCGPFEVFSVAGRWKGNIPFEVFTVAEKKKIRTRGGMVVNPTYTFKNCPKADIIVIPGGGGRRKDGTPFGTRREMENPALLKWIQKMALSCEQVLSVCTGALLIARAGLMEGLSVTTHHMAFGELEKVAPTSARICKNVRVVDNGKIVFSGGVAAGIDAAFYIVGKLLGEQVAQQTAKYVEYDYA